MLDMKNLWRDDQLDEVERSWVLIYGAMTNFPQRIFWADMFLDDSPCFALRALVYQTLPVVDPNQITKSKN